MYEGITLFDDPITPFTPQTNFILYSDLGRREYQFKRASPTCKIKIHGQKIIDNKKNKNKIDIKKSYQSLPIKN